MRVEHNSEDVYEVGHSPSKTAKKYRHHSIRLPGRLAHYSKEQKSGYYSHTKSTEEV